MSDQEQKPEFTLDDMHQVVVDQAEADEALRKGLAPQGTYVTDPDEFGEMTVTPTVIEEKDDQGTVVNHRRVVVLSGRGTARVRIGNETKQVQAYIRAELSPDYRNAKNRETGEELDKPDNRFKLYAQAQRAFATHFNERAKNLAQVVEYLQTTPAKFRLIQVGVPTKANPEPTGEPGNFCIAISAVRASSN